MAGMNLLKALELMKKYDGPCPECGNEYVGNGAGTFEITEDTLRRTCKCGWKVEVKVDESK